jgi:hypothetical protein
MHNIMHCLTLLHVSQDNIFSATSVLMSTIAPGTAPYLTDAQSFVQAWVAGNNGVVYTPDGLANDGVLWGTLRESANAAFLLLVAAKYDTDAARSAATVTWSTGQIGYMLGDAGRSFVIGFGNNPPTHAQHRAASCPDPPAECGWDTFNSPASNAQVLYGGLVGGPGSATQISDVYTDVRSNYVSNEVGCEYSAGFAGALAGLLYYQSGSASPAVAGPSPPPASPPPSSPAFVTFPASPAAASSPPPASSVAASSPPPSPTTSSPPPASPAASGPPPSPITSSPPPASPDGMSPPTPVSNPACLALAPFAQCGGFSSCPSGVTCADALWPGYCAVGATYFPNVSCQRVNAWFWQVLPN